MTSIFDPSRSSKVKSDGANQSSWVLRISAPGVQLRICRRFRDISSQNFDDGLSTLVGLTPGPTFTKGEITCYLPRCTILQNFSPIVQAVYEMCVTKVFHLLILGAKPGPKFTKRGDDLLPTQVYHSAKISSPCVKPCRRYPLQKFANTVTNSKRCIPSMPIGMWG